MPDRLGRYGHSRQDRNAVRAGGGGCDKVAADILPEARTLIDIGGEDAKLVLVKKGKTPDIRMNGNCAGGTGAFIDQMAGLLNINIDDMD
ncbi:MAG: hypothetical protein IKP63_05325, partial [Paludibacteraceae bacterium]|nr:hypothetical protein [Paludibacteraceae bacterium]